MARRPAVLAVGLLAFVTSGCSGLLNSYRTGPDGLSNYDTDLRTLLEREDFEAAVEKVGPENAGPIGDRLLQLMDEALVLHYAGDYAGSNASIDRALVIIDDRYTKSVSKAVFSLATSDRVLAYDPDFTERCFLHYYGALNYLALGDPEEAAVEARRLAYMLDREEPTDLRPGEVDLRRSMRYFTALVFEAAGEINDAAVAYRQVWGDGVDLDLGRTDATVPEPGATAMEPRGIPDGLVLPDEIVPPPGFGDVVVLVENGFVAHRVERGVTIPLFDSDQRAMEVDDSAMRLAVAACIAEREFTDVPGYVGLSTDSDQPWSRGDDGSCEIDDAEALSAWTEEVSDQFPGLEYGGGRPKRRDGDAKGNAEEDEGEEDGDEGGFYLMRVVWPEMRSTTAALPPPRLTVDGFAIAPSITTLDVSGAVSDEYLDAITGILLKSVARAATKYLSYRGARDIFGDDNETLGDIAGLAVNAAGFIMERADTRTWHVLPASVDMIRLRLPEGTHRLALNLDRGSVVLAGDGGSLRTAARLADEPDAAAIDLGDVVVRSGHVRFLTYRKWR